MSIIYFKSANSPDRYYMEVSGEQSIKSFKELVQRAVNLWPDAPAEIKEFGDIVTVGKAQQNYHLQDTSIDRKWDPSKPIDPRQL